MSRHWWMVCVVALIISPCNLSVVRLYSKRLQEEEDAARAYKDFVASFEDANDVPLGSGGQRGLKTFVRAGGSGAR